MAVFVRGMGRNVFKVGQNSYLGNRHINPVRYVRALKRKTVKVIYPDGKEETLNKSHHTPDRQREALNYEKRNKDDMKNDSKTRFNTITVKQYNSIQSKSKIEQTDGLLFERALPDDKRLSKLVTIARSRTYREHQGKILLEGRRLICDALAAGAKPQTLFFSSVERLSELPMDKLQRASLVKVKFKEIKKWSDLIAPQGVIAIFSRPDVHQLAFPKDQQSQSMPLSLICDNIRDPGNLGTILRCAAAAGCKSVLLSKGCVDIWEPKVLRAAMGAHFRLPVFPSLTWEDIDHHLPKDVTVHVADNCTSPVRDVNIQSSQLKKPSDHGWVSNRREKKQHYGQDYSNSDSENETDCETEDEVHEELQVEPRLYCDSWAQRSTAVVIGGETHGLSLESLRLAERTDGRRLYVPLAYCMDSLNSAMAASIVLFEGRRQLLKLLERHRVRN